MSLCKSCKKDCKTEVITILVEGETKELACEITECGDYEKKK